MGVREGAARQQASVAAGCQHAAIRAHLAALTSSCIVSPGESADDAPKVLPLLPLLLTRPHDLTEQYAMRLLTIERRRGRSSEAVIQKPKRSSVLRRPQSVRYVRFAEWSRKEAVRESANVLIKGVLKAVHPSEWR